MTSSRNDDPWGAISAHPNELIGRRADGEHSLGIYWSINSDGATGLLVRGIDSASAPRSFPKPRGISIRLADDAEHGPVLALFLLDQESKDVFLTLCRDVIQFSAAGDQASTATAMVFRRLAHWQSLLSRGRVGELAPHEVRGLMGELWLLDALSQKMGIQAALPSWVAPDDHPQDFALSYGVIEVKTRLAGSRPHVSISSLEQLEVGHLPLHLLVIELTPSDAEGALSLNAMAGKVMKLAGGVGVETQELAELALHRRGYAAFPSYDSPSYVVSGVRAFAVQDDFPRLVRSATDRRVHQATYVLDLTSLAAFELDSAVVLSHVLNN